MHDWNPGGIFFEKCASIEVVYWRPPGNCQQLSVGIVLVEKLVFLTRGGVGEGWGKKSRLLQLRRVCVSRLLDPC